MTKEDDKHSLEPLPNSVLTIDVVLAKLRRSGMFGFLGRVPDAHARRALKAPLALARWIEDFAPGLKTRTEIRVVLVASADAYETVDSGRWFQVVPAILDRAGMIVHITVIPSLTDLGLLRLGMERKIWRTGGGVGDVPAPARFLPVSLRELAIQSDRPVDLVLLLDADLSETNRRQLSAGGLAAAHATGALIGASSRDLVALEKEEWVLARYGFRVPRVTITHDRAFDQVDDCVGEWSDVLWQIAAVPGWSAAPSDRDFRRLDNYEMYLSTLAYRPTHALLGNVTCVIATDDGEHDVVGLPSGLAVDVVTGQLLIEDCEDPEFPVEPRQVLYLSVEHTCGYVVPRELLQRYPSDSAMPFDRGLWAVEVAQAVDAALTPEPRPAGLKRSPDIECPAPQATRTDASEALFRSLRKRQWGAAINILLENPALLGSVDEDGISAAFLLKGGVSPTGPGSHSLYPVSLSTQSENFAVLEMLVRYREGQAVDHQVQQTGDGDDVVPLRR